MTEASRRASASPAASRATRRIRAGNDRRQHGGVGVEAADGLHAAEREAGGQQREDALVVLRFAGDFVANGLVQREHEALARHPGFAVYREGGALLGDPFVGVGDHLAVHRHAAFEDQHAAGPAGAEALALVELGSLAADQLPGSGRSASMRSTSRGRNPRARLVPYLTRRTAALASCIASSERAPFGTTSGRPLALVAGTPAANGGRARNPGNDHRTAFPQLLRRKIAPGLLSMLCSIPELHPGAPSRSNREPIIQYRDSSPLPPPPAHHGRRRVVQANARP